MTRFVVKNNVGSTVADDPLAQSATTLHVPTGEGSNFPSTFPFMLTIWDNTTYPDPGNDPGMEIVKCTGRSNDTLTIVRAQEDTSDVEHSKDECVAMLITAGVIDALISEVVDDTSPQLGGDLDPNGHGFAIGSDADGDMYYRASGALARLAKGSASQVLTMNGSATAPEWTDASGDMLKSIYDPDEDGIIAVEQTEANNYTHPSAPACQAATSTQSGYATATQIAKLDGIEDNANNYTHPSSRQCTSGTWAWGSISGKPSTYPPSSHTHSGGDITSQVSDADKVDGCHAGTAENNVYKIPSSGYYSILYKGAATGIEELGPSTDGYQLTTHYTGGPPTWAAASDLIFSDTHCPKCGKRFETGDTLVLYVVGHNEVGDTLTIPMHKECAEAPKKTVTIKRKVFEDRHVLDELTGETKIQRVQKTQKKTVTKHKLKEGYELDHKTGRAIKINEDGSKDKTQHDLSIVLETFEDTVEEPVYEDVEFTL